MIIDTSAIRADLFGEEDAAVFARAISGDSRRLVSAFSALESAIVLESRKGEAGAMNFDLFFHNASVDIVPLTADQVEFAREAWRKFGKGRHQASLNIGDCCSYALSKLSGEPLLSMETDSEETDSEETDSEETDS